MALFKCFLGFLRSSYSSVLVARPAVLCVKTIHDLKCQVAGNSSAGKWPEKGGFP